jgi:hypothetical protein
MSTRGQRNVTLFGVLGLGEGWALSAVVAAAFVAGGRVLAAAGGRPLRGGTATGTSAGDVHGFRCRVDTTSSLLPI